MPTTCTPYHLQLNVVGLKVPGSSSHIVQIQIRTAVLEPLWQFCVQIQTVRMPRACFDFFSERVPTPTEWCVESPASQTPTNSGPGNALRLRQQLMAGTTLCFVILVQTRFTSTGQWHGTTLHWHTVQQKEILIFWRSFFGTAEAWRDPPCLITHSCWLARARVKPK